MSIDMIWIVLILVTLLRLIFNFIFSFSSFFLHRRMYVGTYISYSMGAFKLIQWITVSRCYCNREWYALSRGNMRRLDYIIVDSDVMGLRANCCHHCHSTPTVLLWMVIMIAFMIMRFVSLLILLRFIIIVVIRSLLTTIVVVVVELQRLVSN